MSHSRLADAMRRDRRIVIASIIALTGLAWIYTGYFAREAAQMSGSMPMPAMVHWSPLDYAFMFVMWMVMMVAMMLPSATPMILLFDRVRAKRASEQRPFATVMAFVSGYLFAWAGFSLVATLLNWVLHTQGQLDSMMGRMPPQLGAMLLIAAGLFQWTRLKHACLEHCRSPIGFLTVHWHEGTPGAIMMGLHHGAYCLGCCWLLMILLFTLGIMNLTWIALLTVVIVAEKVLPGGSWLSRFLGGILVIWGSWMFLAA